MQTVAEHTGTVKPKHVPIFPQTDQGFYNKKGDGHASISPVFIDKIALTFHLQDIDHIPSIREELLDTNKEGLAFKHHGLIDLKLPKSSRLSFSLLAPNPPGSVDGPWCKDSLLHVQLFHGVRPTVRIEWNPANWNAPQVAHAWAQLTRFLLLASEGDSPLLGYTPLTLLHLLRGASITKVHATVDISGITMDEIAWWDGKQDRTSIGKGIKHGTSYLGPFDKRANKTCIYDKGRHLAETGAFKLPDETEKRVRVEVRANGMKVRGECLHQLTNQFRKLQCSSIREALAIAGVAPELRGLSQAALTRMGVPDALLLLPTPAYRKNLETALLASRLPLWNPAQIWKGWPAAVAKALPGVLAKLP